MASSEEEDRCVTFMFVFVFRSFFPLQHAVSEWDGLGEDLTVLVCKLS